MQHPGSLSDELRDGLLQEIVAASMIVTSVRDALPDDPGNIRHAAALEVARTTLEGNARVVRGLITQLHRAEDGGDNTNVVRRSKVA